MDQTDQLIALAFKEDLPNGDLTTELVSQSEKLKTKIGRIKVIAKEDLVLSGTEAFEKALHFKEPKCKIDWSFKDGDVLLAGQIACVIKGDQISLLSAERVALNFLGRLSGIATITRSFVSQLEGSEIKLLDTRKTTPGYRLLEKKAVTHGGGTNHRMNLSDAVLIKDNHIAMAGGVTAALKNVFETFDGAVEIEVDTLEQLEEALKFNVTRILLDNMTDEMLMEASKRIPGNIEIEVSGGINLQRLKSLKGRDINFISVGEITHSAPNVDFSMEFDW